MKRAAAELNTVQSNVTARIRLLEDELGVALFERRPNGMKLTPAGVRLLPHAFEVRAALFNAKRAIDDIGVPSGPLAIGCRKSTSALHLTRLLEAYVKAYPDVDVQVRTETSPLLTQQVLERRIEGALVCDPVRHSELTSEVILEAGTPKSLIGALCVWMAVSVSLGGFGLTLRALESRRGRLSLKEFQGLYNHTPALAVLFLITGLASVGFPGTFGFIGTEMLVDGAIDAFPLVGIAVIFASALNGISVVHAYFRLFTGTTHTSLVSLGIVRRERFAVITMLALIFIGGLIPQYNVVSRQRAADRLLRQRATFIGKHGSHSSEPVSEHH